MGAFRGKREGDSPPALDSDGNLIDWRLVNVSIKNNVAKWEGRSMWLSADMTLYFIDEMHIEHIRNCIARIVMSLGSKNVFRGQYLEPLTSELKRREELSQVQQGD